MSDDNNRVTLAVLGQQMLEMLRRQDDVEEKLDGIGEKLDRVVTSHAQCAAVQETRWEYHKEEHRVLNSKKWAGDIGAGAAGVVAAIVALVVKSP